MKILVVHCPQASYCIAFTLQNAYLDATKLIFIPYLVLLRVWPEYRKGRTILELSS